MSIRVMTQVWERSQHAGTDLLMLLCLADFSDDQGNSYPAVPTLAAKCRMSARNAGYILRTLQANGELQVQPNEGPRGTNRYRIVLEALGGLKPIAGVEHSEGVQSASGVGMKGAAGVQSAAPLQPTSDTPAMGFRSPLKPTSDEPSLNRQEPSFKSRRVRPAPGFVLPEWVPADVWADFVDMRKTIRKPLTLKAKGLQVKALTALRAEGHDPRAVLEQSIAASWQGLFPLKGQTQTAGTASSPFTGCSEWYESRQGVDRTARDLGMPCWADFEAEQIRRGISPRYEQFRASVIEAEKADRPSRGARPPSRRFESFRERDERLASERVAEATGGLLGKRAQHQQPLEEVFDVTPRRLDGTDSDGADIDLRVEP